MWWYMSVIPAFPGAEVGRIASFRPAWVTYQDSVSKRKREEFQDGG
jgi:hypothetical protein